MKYIELEKVKNEIRGTIVGGLGEYMCEILDELPTIELPKQHGRLIDVDHFEERMCNIVKDNIRGYDYPSELWGLAFSHLDEEDTILEAEE